VKNQIATGNFTKFKCTFKDQNKSWVETKNLNKMFCIIHKVFESTEKHLDFLPWASKHVYKKVKPAKSEHKYIKTPEALRSNELVFNFMCIML
jgi:hypothetical protein